MIPGRDFFVRLISMPIRIEAVISPNGDGTFDIYVNSRLSENAQRAALEHELRHMKLDHFYHEGFIGDMELEAHGMTVARRAPEPVHTTRLFCSAEAAVIDGANGKYRQIVLPDDYRDADFAVPVSTDEMEPVARNGTYVYFVYADDLADSECGLVTLDGAVKFRCMKRAGDWRYLMNVNPRRRDEIDVIAPDGGRTLAITARMIMPPKYRATAKRRFMIN